MTGLVRPDGRPLTPDVITRTATPVERRDPTAATRSMYYLGQGQPLPVGWNAQRAIDFQYYANVIVWRCVQIIARTVSSLPFRAGPATPERSGMTAPHRPDAPLARLLGPPPGGPAPKLSARRLWAWTIAQRIVTGRHAWEIELADGKDSTPVAFWPLVSALLKAYPSEAGVEWFRAFEYGLTPDKAKRLRPDQVFYGWDPSLNDFRQPESALQAAKLPVELARMMDTYNVAFLRNDARPAALVVTEAFGTDEEYQAFRRDLNDNYAGAHNAGKAMVVEATGGEKGVTGAIDVKVLGLSQKDALFLEQHRAALEQVAIALGVPWSLLDASGRTFDNASEEGQNFWRNTIAPLCETLADEVNLDLAPRLGPDVGWFDLSGIPALQTRPDPITAAVGAPAMVQAQLMTVNEGRADYGLPPVPDGDRFMSADEIALLRGNTMQVATVRDAPQVEERAAVPSPPVPPSDVRAPGGEDRSADPEAVEARRAKLWATADATVRTIEGRWEKALRRLFARQEKATLARLEGKRGRQATRAAEPDPSQVFDPNFWQSETSDLVEDLYSLATAAGAARVTDLFGVAFDLDAEWAQEFITTRANQLAGQVTDTTRQAIVDALAAGAAEGESIPEIAARVRHVFEVATTSRATTIARTEVISAYNGSASLSAAQLPADVVAGQEWIATRDGRTRPEHADADGQVVPVGAPFAVGGALMAYPGDPGGDPALTVNCRCTVAFLTPDEYSAAVDEASRTVPVGAARALLMMLRRDTPHDRIRQALQEIAA
ncbi:MAG TPA: phage portal protein [Acidimicrobiales bacterium]